MSLVISCFLSVGIKQVYIECITDPIILPLQIHSMETESILNLSDLSPDDNGRVIVCSAENMVGQTEATLQLNITCKDIKYGLHL